MKAVLCKRLDGPESLEIAEIPTSEPGPGEVLIDVRAAALNFFDTLITRGKYQHKPELPFSPSGEIAGTVAALGPGVSGFAIGERVCAYIGWGGAREQVITDARRVVHIPDGVSDEVAAGLTITYGTALHGLVDRGAVENGETVAVLGASGGAGLAAVEIAKLLGAHVIAGASSAEKLELCARHGADTLIDYSSGDLKTMLREATQGSGVDVIYDCIGGRFSEPALRAMAWEGRFLVVGFAAGEIPKMPLNLLLVKGCAMLGVFWGEAVARDLDTHRAHVTRLLKWVAAGRLRPRIDKQFPLEDAVEALGVIAARKATGKIVLKI